ncbi:MAG: hypothetical protein JJE52_16420 [Acidimicrobiia bacterium]|nr:hypothetical protein [Acidimicrobiia bacterium]
MAGRPMSLVATCDQWARSTHEHTAIECSQGELILSWIDPPQDELPAIAGCLARGLVADRLCRTYRLGAEAIERDGVTIVGGGPESGPVGPDFTVPPTRHLVDAVGIAVDDDDRLFVADRATRSISVIDLWSRRLLRTIDVSSPTHPDRHPTGLTSYAGAILAVVQEPPGLLRLSATRGPDELELPSGFESLPADAAPVRVAVLADHTPVVLAHDPGGDGWIVAGERPPLAVGQSSDIVVDVEGAVVVAPCAEADGRAVLRRFVLLGDGWARARPLDASGYDGNGIFVDRDGRIAYDTARGLRHAAAAHVDYETDGTCVTYRLDSGTARNRWGRLFVEACIPDGTRCSVATSTSDDEHIAEMPHAPALPAACIPLSDGTPPLMPPSLVPALEPPRERLHQRSDAVTPWWPPDEHLSTYEAPVLARPGRYLWVTLRLHGNQRRTPRIRELRVEHTSHTLMRRLPGVFSADPQQAEFLQRYLATFDGLLHDLDVRSRSRDILVDPSGTPIEALDWLASFVGLALDDRWADAARRRLVREIVPLYQRRGTMWALGRYIAIYLAAEHADDDDRPWVEPVIVEHFRLRGVGGPLLGDDPSLTTRSVLGAGFRVGGAVGALGSAPLDPDDDHTSAFSTHAHRFTVGIPQPLDDEQDAAVRHILATERPAHTIYDLCALDAGMRVGRGLHVGMSSIVGPTGAMVSAIAGQLRVSQGGIIGGTATGIAVEAARVGATTRVG